MNRKKFLKQACTGTGALALSPWFASCTFFADAVTQVAFNKKLPLPREISDSFFDLTASSANIEISDTINLSGFQFNGIVPGPTIRHKRGSELDIHFNNDIGQDSIIHWHGLIVPPEMDGHPKDVIACGAV